MKLEDYKYSVDYSKIPKAIKTEKNLNLFDLKDRKEYFEIKCGKEIKLLKEYLKTNTFIGYLVAPKLAGKGSYTVLLREVLGNNLFEVISVGDLIRNAHLDFEKNGKKSEIYKYGEGHYRGELTLDEVFEALINRDGSQLLSNDFALMLIKREIDRIGKKAIFIDGFPRNVDQVSYSLYFRELVNYREDPDFFVLINIPMQIIADRIKGRRACPKCGNQRNIPLSVTPEVKYDEKKKELNLICDISGCQNEIMVAKEGDEKGIELIRKRIETDLDLMDYARKIYGIPAIEIYNAIELDKADEYSVPYERTQITKLNCEEGKIKRENSEYVIEIDDRKYIGFVQIPPVVQLIKQLVKVLNLK